MDFDFPVLDARIDNLKASHHAIGSGQHIGSSDAGAFEGLFEHESDFAFGLGLNQGVGRDGFTFVIDHAVGQPAKIGLVHAQHVHHGFAGDTNFFANHALARTQAACCHALLHGIGIGNGDVGVAAG